jgi:hypothetical protein
VWRSRQQYRQLLAKAPRRFEHEHIHVVFIIKANEMHYCSVLFGTELYMFRTDLLSIIGSLNTVFTAIGICRTSYVD